MSETIEEIRERANFQLRIRGLQKAYDVRPDVVEAIDHFTNRVLDYLKERKERNEVIPAER
jgi:hypothetical protein